MTRIATHHCQSGHHPICISNFFSLFYLQGNGLSFYRENILPKSQTRGNEFRAYLVSYVSSVSISLSKNEGPLVHRVTISYSVIFLGRLKTMVPQSIKLNIRQCIQCSKCASLQYLLYETFIPWKCSSP